MRSLPPRRTRNEELARFAARLRSKPGDWQRLPRPDGATTSYASIASLSSKINRGRTKAFPPDEFEAAHRGDAVYVRYIGPSDEQSEAA